MTGQDGRPHHDASGDRAKPLRDNGIDERDVSSSEEVAAHERWLQENRPPHHG
jgi:hypothetical protein